MLKRFPLSTILLITTLLTLVACAQNPQAAEPSTTVSSQTSTEPPVEVNLKNDGPAPELRNTIWLNTNGQSLRLADLRGKVVALDFWTFACINCQHVMPALKDWHKAYKDQGLVIIGDHFPEFNYEADLGNLKKAVGNLGLEYAIAQDNNGETWNAYNTRYWPTLVLIDKKGDIRYTHIGEGAYQETEAAIKALLAEPYP